MKKYMEQLYSLSDFGHSFENNEIVCCEKKNQMTIECSCSLVSTNNADSDKKYFLLKNVVLQLPI